MSYANNFLLYIMPRVKMVEAFDRQNGLHMCWEPLCIVIPYILSAVFAIYVETASGSSLKIRLAIFEKRIKGPAAVICSCPGSL